MPTTKPEKLASIKEWRAKHPDRVAKHRRRYREKHHEALLAYGRSPTIRQRNRASYQRNRDRINEARKLKWRTDKVFREESIAKSVAKQKENPEAQMRRWFKRKYGLSFEDLESLRKTQNNACAICLSRTHKLKVDHNHHTGQVRALLCQRCNTGIGMFLENSRLMRKAASYVEAFNGITATA